MAKITFLGSESNIGVLEWGKYKFELNKAVDCDNEHIIKKARGNPQFYKVEDADEKTEMATDASPVAKAIGTLSEKK